MLHLRSVTTADNSLIKSIFESVLPFYHELMPGIFEANIANCDILSEKGLDFNATGLTTYLAFSGEMLLGMAALAPLNARQAYLGAFHFLPAYHRKGWGSRVLAEIEKRYTNLGFQEILILVHQDADWARHFYRQQAYHEQAETTHAIISYGGPALQPLLTPKLTLWVKRLK